MDTGAKIREVKRLFKEYLTEQYPTWSESSVNTHVSDAFYIWNNTIISGFWKVFVSDESMENAKESIADYLKNEKKSGTYEVRTKGYFNDLQRLKVFFDNVYGGVENCIGDEFDAEEEIYSACKKFYDATITEDEALDELCEKVPSFNRTSHKMTLGLFECMIEGRKYTRRQNIEITICLIRNIGRDYGIDKMINALSSTRDNIIYYYGKTANKSNCMRKSCQKIADENDIEISFGDDIFQDIVSKKNTTSVLADEDIESVRYWLYSPGDNACKWNEFYSSGIMAIGWSGIGDLTTFENKDAMKQEMKDVYGEQYTYKNAAHATWQFANEVKPGDIIFVKKGLYKIIGRGVVTGEYQYKPELEDEEYEWGHVRSVNWTHNGEWKHPGQAVMKTLTEITQYTEYVAKLNALFEDETTTDSEETEVEYPLYSVDDFLNEVYISDTNYEILTNLLRNKKNIILQGAPGVGKTFAAKRLAYSMMGVKDSSRVMMVQFHQSYSYEDFIMGFRPANTGFELKKGPFYTFCKRAETDMENDYFFIIDEINRGNLSKIFGELFMLIESDKRGVSLQLLYSDEKFSVPSNVHIIGMMNTADRSLAMLDYALRRRFAFFEFPPAFETAGFRNYKQEKNNKKFDNLIATIQKLNIAIESDETLGRGFRIGHSYFCTENEIDDMWLNSVVVYEIIPLLNEYWFDEASKVKDWECALLEAIR